MPDERVPLHIFEPRYRELIGECLDNLTEFGLIYQQGVALSPVGTRARVEGVLERFPDGRLNVVAAGTTRFRLIEETSGRSFITARVGDLDDIGDPPSDLAPFHAEERKVVHLEPGAIEALRAFYARLLLPGDTVLDLMSSWRSHLPDGLGHVTGLGLNAAEMADNPQLDEYVIHDLNRTPRLPLPDASFDALVCPVSLQ